MSTKKSSIGECLVYGSVCGILHTLPDRPFRTCVILGLDGTKPRYRIGRFIEWSPRNMLVEQSLVRNIYDVHYLVV